MRTEIKRLYQRMDKLEGVQHAQRRYLDGYARTTLPIKEFAVETMLSRGSAREKEKTLAFLRELGFPAKMPSEENFRFGRLSQ